MEQRHLSPKRSGSIIDRARNERQKASLLTHLASMHTGVFTPPNSVTEERSLMKGLTYENLRMQRVRFLRTELDLGTTFALIASRTSNAAKKERNLLNARKAYDTVVQHLGNTTVTGEELDTLNEKLSVLKGHLLALGEAI